MLGTIEIKTRPLKLAYLVDPNNSKQTREAIQLASTLWGGDYCPIIPLYKRMPPTWRDNPLKAPQAKGVILGHIDAFDPDILVQFSKDIPPYLNELGLEIIRPDEVWRRLGEDRSLSPQCGIGIFEILNDIYDAHFKYKAKYPIKIVIPAIPKKLPLFWASVFGELPPKILPHVTKHYREPLEITEASVNVSAFGELTAGNVLFPRRITTWALSRFNLPQFGRDACVYFMDAAKLDDIIDFWNLRATGRTVLPLPKQFCNDAAYREILEKFLKAHRRSWRHEPKVCDVASIIRSRNSTMEEMQDYAKTLKFEREAGDPSTAGFLSLQHWYPRIWDEWGRDKDGAVSDIYGQEEDSIELSDTKDLRIRFRPLLPKFAAKHAYHGEPRCANEVSFNFYGQEERLAEVFPKSSGTHFVRAISGLTSFRGEWRVGRHGLVKLVTRAFNETRDVPASEPIFFSWLADRGWAAELSTPGILAKQIFKKLDGYPRMLMTEALLGLLEHMNGGLVRKDGTPMTDNKVGADRDMAVAEVKTRLGAASTRSDLHGFLISKGIFKLGLRTQCPHCLRNSWFALDSIGDALHCPRCLNSFPAVGNVDRGTWSYKTAGPFSVPNYADGAYGVLLALGFFTEHRLTTLRTTPVLSFTAKAKDKGKDLEADFAMFWQESIYGETKDGILFGECKTYGRFGKKDFDRMRFLAKTFPGAVLVFSTLRKSLSRDEVLGIRRIAKTGRKHWKAERPINPVLILTGTELLNWEQPPYCWEEATKKKFEHLTGLLEVCNATQQIYLNLPSWSAEWHDRWEERRKRRMARQTPNDTGTTAA